jgi:hypothetical protein
MPGIPAIDRPIKLTTTIRESLRVRLDLYLYSEVESRVPKGAYQQFLEGLIREFFDSRSMDLAPFGLEGSVKGSERTISLLKERLEGEQKDV